MREEELATYDYEVVYDHVRSTITAPVLKALSVLISDWARMREEELAKCEAACDHVRSIIHALQGEDILELVRKAPLDADVNVCMQ